jgi:hypothetical protein
MPGPRECPLCKAEGQPCTFDMPPVAKIKKIVPPAQAALDSLPKASTSRVPAAEHAPSPSNALPAARAANQATTLIRYDETPEHLSETVDFEELRSAGSLQGFPSFRAIESDPNTERPSAEHRADPGSSALSMSTTTRREVFAVVEPFTSDLIRLYFQRVWPVFPAYDRHRMVLFLNRKLAHHSSAPAERNISPMLAASLAVAAQ